MDKSKCSYTLMITTCNQSAQVGSPYEDESAYRSIVRALQYIVITRPDIAFAVTKVCQFMHKPLDQYFKAIKRILRYLQNTLDHVLVLTATSKLSLVGFSYANWGMDVDDRRSTMRFCVFVEGNPLS